jgi:hypothetical protein
MCRIGMRNWSEEGEMTSLYSKLWGIFASEEVLWGIYAGVTSSLRDFCCLETSIEPFLLVCHVIRTAPYRKSHVLRNVLPMLRHFCWCVVKIRVIQSMWLVMLRENTCAPSMWSYICLYKQRFVAMQLYINLYYVLPRTTILCCNKKTDLFK